MPNNRIVYGNSYWDFVRMAGHPDLPGMELEVIKKRGVDGVALREQAFHAEVTPLYLTSMVTSVVARTQRIADMKNLQGTQSNIYDATGEAYLGVSILSVRLIKSRYVLKPNWYGVSAEFGWVITHHINVIYPYGSF